MAFGAAGCMNDSSVGVRVRTAKALCSIPGVSQNVLLQTLDKKLFSNLRVRQITLFIFYFFLFNFFKFFFLIFVIIIIF